MSKISSSLTLSRRVYKTLQGGMEVGYKDSMQPTSETINS